MRIFNEVLGASWQLFWNNLKAFVPLILLTSSLGLIPIVAEVMGISKEHPVSFFLDVLVVLLLFWLMAATILQVESITMGRKWSTVKTVWEGACNAPAYLLYNLMHAFSFLIGLILFVLPGFWALMSFVFMPIASILDPDIEESYFHYSRNLVKGHYVEVGLYLVFLLLLNLATSWTYLVPEGSLRLIGDVVMLIPEGVVAVFSEVFLVMLYYRFKSDRYALSASGKID